MVERAAATSEVAAELGLAPATVQKYARDRRIPFNTTPGGHRRFNVEEVRTALANAGDAGVGIAPVSEVRNDGSTRATAVVLTALDVEYDAVRARLDNLRPVRAPSGTRFEVGDLRGDFLDWKVAVAEIGEGNLDAAIEAGNAISHFDPDLVLFVGVAGGFKDDLNHGDVVVASKVYDYHGGKADEEFYARPMAFATLHSLNQLVRTVRRTNWLDTATAGQVAGEPRVQLKPIAAGEIVVVKKSSEVARQIKAHYNDTAAVDMESYGTYLAAQRASRPALAVRGISDLLDDKTLEADADRQPMASSHAAAFALALLRAIEPEDLGARSGQSVPSPAPSSAHNELISRIPPNVVTQIELARRSSPQDAATLARDLASDVAAPAQLVGQLTTSPPAWLARSTSPHLWAAVGEFASAHDSSEEAVEAFVQAAERGGPEAPVWMARAAFASAGDHQEKAQELIARAHELAGGPHPFVDVMDAAISVVESEDVGPVLEATEAYQGDDLLVEMIRGRALYVSRHRAEALTVFEAALENYPANTAAALETAKLLLARCAADESDRPITDLNRARELALQARDLRRGWRGDSPEAAAIGVQVAAYAGDLEAVLKMALPPPEGEATDAEAKHTEVLLYASNVVLRKGNHQRALELAEQISDPVERDLAQGDCFRYIPNSNDLARDAYKRALDRAEVDHRRIQAYFGLAKVGEWPLPGLDELAGKDREVADLITAEASLARGDTDGAIRIYRRWRQSPRALDALVGVYLDNDRVDEAVDALRDGATRHRDPELRLRAAHVLTSVGRCEDAEAEARRAMDALPNGSRQHRELRKLRIQLLASLDDRWAEVEEQALASLDGGVEDRDLLDMRWALVFARYNQRRPESALEEMTRDLVLKPRDEQDAVLAIQLYRLGAHSPDMVREVLDLADRYAASEEVCASAFMAAIEMSRDTGLPPSVVGQLRTLQSDFFERFPDSQLITRIQAEDAETVAEKTIAHLEETLGAEAQQFEEITQGVIAGSLPYGFLSAFAHKPYAEAFIKRAAGFLPVASADADVARTEKETALQALDGTVVAEASSMYTVGLTGLEPEGLLANFHRVIVPPEVLDDALATKNSLGLRSSGIMGWDARSNRPVLTEIDEEQAEAWAKAADRLVKRVRECEIAPRRRPTEDVEADASLEPTRPFLSAVELAKQSALPLFSDDTVLRQVARSESVASFGTYDLLTALKERGDLDDQEYASASMSLRRNRAVDLPRDEEQVLALAAEDNWQPGPATLSFTRPALWREDFVATLGLYRRCISGTLGKDEAMLADWCASAAVGVARSAPPTTAAHGIGTILAYTVWTGSLLAGELKVHLFPQLLAAVRQVSGYLGVGDPLPAAVEVLRDMLGDEVGPSYASQVFASLIEDLESEERTAALQTFLRPSRPSGSK